MSQLDREQVATLLGVYKGQQPVLIDHPRFRDPLPVKGVSLKDGRIILYCDSEEEEVIPTTPAVEDRAIIFVDGACSGNPGPGGWAHVTQIGAEEWERSGAVCSDTTNQRMEIASATHALQHLIMLKDRYPVKGVIVYSDSKYVIETMKGKWQKNTNLDLWGLLLYAARHFEIEWRHCKGGSDPTQGRCDKLAKAATKSSMSRG